MRSRQTRCLAIVWVALVTIFAADASQAITQRTSATAAEVTSTREIAQRSTQALVVVLNLDSNGEVQALGSGFVFRAGVIATNHHVIRGASRVLVRRSGMDESFRASVVGVSERVDLALLQVDGLAVTPLEIGKDSTVEVGDAVFAVGNPKGLEATFSNGLVSAKRTLDGVAMLQITAPISPGSSGGPILDRKGRVIGVAVGKIEGGDLLNFAIPVSNLLLLESGDISPDVHSVTESERAPTVGASIDSLFVQLQGELALHSTLTLKGPSGFLDIKTVGLSLSGNWLTLESATTARGATEPHDINRLELLLSDVVDIKPSLGDVAIVTGSSKVRITNTSGSKVTTKVYSGALITVDSPASARRLQDLLSSMVIAAKANRAGDVYTRTGPSVDATLEFIKRQVEIHGQATGTLTDKTGTRFSIAQRVDSVDLSGDVLTIEITETMTFRNGPYAGRAGVSRHRVTCHLSDMTEAARFNSALNGECLGIVSAVDAVRVVSDSSSGRMERRTPLALIPFEECDVSIRVINALNYLISLAHDQKEPDPF